MAEASRATILKFSGHEHIAQRLILSTLTGRPLRISGIRSNSPTNPGLAPHEVSLLRLLDNITNGTVIEFSYTGTTVLYKPGLITGSAAGQGAASQGGMIRHEIPKECSRGVSWFLIPLCLLAPFSKQRINIVITGPGVITSATRAGDVSVDTVRNALLPVYRQFDIQNNVELRILKRSCAGRDGRGGGGEVQLIFGHQVRLPKTVHLLNPGRIKKIGGVAYSTGVSGSNNKRMIEAARGILNPLSQDVYINSDVSNAPLVLDSKGLPGAKRKTGLGFGISLVAESSTGMIYSADMVSPPAGGELPEDIGRHCAYKLLDVIAQGGCAPIGAAQTILILMAMGSEDVGRVRLGQDVIGSPEMITLARDLRIFGASGWGLKNVETDTRQEDVMVSIVGRGIGNVGRKIA